MTLEFPYQKKDVERIIETCFYRPNLPRELELREHVRLKIKSEEKPYKLRKKNEKTNE